MESTLGQSGLKYFGNFLQYAVWIISQIPTCSKLHYSSLNFESATAQTDIAVALEILRIALRHRYVIQIYGIDMYLNYVYSI